MNANSARLIHDPAQSDDWAWKAWARTESFKRYVTLGPLDLQILIMNDCIKINIDADHDRCMVGLEAKHRATHLYFRGPIGDVDIDRPISVLISKVMEELPQCWHKCNYRTRHSTDAHSIHHIDPTSRNVADWNDWLALCGLGTHSAASTSNTRTK
ncbi:hypothetical protein LB505_009867 [Fusarium chuoi]|nr:hypothetical protein LB505_009867 [Fusarium chuoi]